MPSEIMDQRRLSLFSEEIRFPAERLVGFWRPESAPDHGRLEGRPLMSGNKPGSQSMISNSMERLELPLPYLFKDQKPNESLEHQLKGRESFAGKPMTSWKPIEGSGYQSDIFACPTTGSMEGHKHDLHTIHYETGLFSSSLSEIFNKNLRLSANDSFAQCAGISNSKLGEVEPFESLEEIEAQTIGNLLPDDDDLFSGVIDHHGSRPNSGDDIEEDLFYSGGGMEIEADGNFSGNNISDFISGVNSPGQQARLSSAFSCDYPYGEHPSRTLFVRNINSNVEDAELKDLFQQYGDIHALYTACKHRGFVMVSYYDIRSASNAMRALQSKPLRHRKLDIHFSIPKGNTSEQDVNQGMVVVFNLDSSVSNDDLCQIFGVYGEIKEINEAPDKRHHKVIEFYDVRAAEAALCALNRGDIAGKQIKLEAGHPGSTRRCLMQQFYSELEQEETNCWQDSPMKSSAELHGTLSLGAITSNGLDIGAIQGLPSALHSPVTTFMETALHGIPSSVPHNLSSPLRVGSVGGHDNLSSSGNHSHSLGQMNFGFLSAATFAPHSLPEYHDGLPGGVPCNSPGNMSSIPININSIRAEGIENRHIHRATSGALNSHSFGHNGTAYGSLGNKSCPLHGNQFFMGNPNSYEHYPPGAMMWPNSPSFNISPAQHQPHINGLPQGQASVLNTGLALHPHHVGSAPNINPAIWDRQHVYAGDPMETSAFHPGSLGSIGFSGSSMLHPLELASHSIFPHSSGNHIDPSVGSARGGIPQQRCVTFHGRNSMIPMPASFDAPNDRMRNRRSDANANQTDNKKQYELDIDRIVRGEDSRTTLMIKNIPNKYTSKMLLAAIDENHRGTYDFIYLPIDFKNKCNVGYAFINMIDPQHIIPFYQSFNGKKWEKFNSEKVASLAFARIQGRAALIAHFQNSSLMNEDKRCRPILFHSDGPNAGDQEPFPVGNNVRSRPGRSRTSINEENHQESPSTSANGEDGSNGTDSSSSSTRDSE